jgi:bloom syndrome protein
MLCVLARLRHGTSDVRILFATPEKVARSDALIRLLSDLNGQGRFARVVIDEAHCVSQVGVF